MPLTDEPPPSSRPAAQYPWRPLSEGSGSVMKPQSVSGLPISFMPAAGSRFMKPLPLPPASSSTTELPGFSDSRFASTQPALPPPAIT